LLAPRLVQQALRVLVLDGTTPAEVRDRRIDRFQRGEADVFLISLKAGGFGLNLTAADTVIHMDPWWNPAVEDQATARAHRMGQHKPVTAVRLVARGTVEEAVLELHAAKRALAAGVLEGSDLAAQLGTEDLVDLIRTQGQPR
jgi:SNF2 family DNA or RNA helicase